MRMRDIINLINEGGQFGNIAEEEVIPFPKASVPHKPNATKDVARNMRDFMTDITPLEHLYAPGDTLKHRKYGEIVDVEAVEPGPDPIITVRVRSTGKRGEFFASDFDPAPIDHWNGSTHS